MCVCVQIDRWSTSKILNERLSEIDNITKRCAQGIWWWLYIKCWNMAKSCYAMPYRNNIEKIVLMLMGWSNHDIRLAIYQIYIFSTTFLMASKRRRRWNFVRKNIFFKLSKDFLIHDALKENQFLLLLSCCYYVMLLP